MLWWLSWRMVEWFPTINISSILCFLGWMLLLALLAAGTLCFLLHWGALLLQSQRSFISLNSYKTDNGDLFYNFQGLCRLLRSSSIQLLKSAFFHSPLLLIRTWQSLAPLSSKITFWIFTQSHSATVEYWTSFLHRPFGFFQTMRLLFSLVIFVLKTEAKRMGGDIFWAFASS